jgi:type IV pilus assembly protein PilM
MGRAELPPGAVIDGEVADPAAAAAAIKTLWRQARLRTNRVILGVSNQRVVVRLVDLPWMEPQELRRSIAYQAGDYLPFAVNEAELDFSVIDEQDTGERRLLRVLLVAAQKDMLAGHLRAAAMAGLHPVEVDVNPVALLRSLAPVAGLAEGAEALVDIGGRVTNVVIHDGGVLRFIRILLMGGEDVTAALERTPVRSTTPTPTTSSTSNWPCSSTRSAAHLTSTGPSRQPRH